MHKVLIVDDEKPVRIAISKLGLPELPEYDAQ